MDTLAELFAHVLTIFCTFAAYACCVHFKRYKSHNRYKWNIPYDVKPIDTSFNWGNGVAPI